MLRTVTEVAPDGTPLREIDILEAHRSPGILHRAFSVFVFTPDGKELMIQKRFSGKPTFGGQWGNTCCSHQFAGEGDREAGMRRLQEEMGFVVELRKGPVFTYQAEDPRGNGMAEHEHDTMLIGSAGKDIVVTMNPQEAEDWKWVELSELRRDVSAHPEKYVPWLHIALTHLS